MISTYNEVNDFYIQKKENYKDLKALHTQVIEHYQIDLDENENFKELKRKIEYKEHMINGLEPNVEVVQYYQPVFAALFWTMLLAIWINHSWQKRKEKTTENRR